MDFTGSCGLAERGAALRVRLAGFFQPIYRILLEQNAPLGFQLWTVLNNADVGLIRFDTTDIPFRAKDNAESNRARTLLFDASWNDDAISSVATACDRYRRDDWRSNTIDKLITSPDLWKRAKPLVLVSLSDLKPDAFEELLVRANIAGTWVGDLVPSFRENLRRNALARYWYAKFMSSPDNDEAWAALQLVLVLADERMLNWQDEGRAGFLA